MKTSAPKKSGEKEMRVSDWLRLKKVSVPDNSATGDPAGNNHAVAINQAPAQNITLTPPAGATIAERNQAAAATQARPILQPPRVLDGFPHVTPTPAAHVESVPTASPTAPHHEDGHHGPALSIDPFRYFGSILQRKGFIIACALTGLVSGFLLGYQRGDTWTASMTLMFRDVPTAVSVEGSGISYKPKQFDTPTLTAILTSDRLLQRVGPKIKPPMTARGFTSQSEFTQERGAEYVTLTFRGASTAEGAVDAVNTWGQEAVKFTEELQSHEVTGTRDYLQQQTLEENINIAKTELTTLRAQYADENPLVKEKISKIQWIEERLKEMGNNGGKSTDQGAAKFIDSPDKKLLGYFSVLSPATEEAAGVKSLWFKSGIMGLGGLFVGLFLGLGLILTREVLDHKLRTPRELELATGTRNIQKIPRISAAFLRSPNEIASLWTRIVGASPHELVCFWTPAVFEQPYLVMQTLLNLTSKQAVPLIWVDAGAGLKPPADFQPIELGRLSLNQPLQAQRYWITLDAEAISSVEAENISAVLSSVAVRHKIPVWLGIQGEIVEPGCSLARHAHRVKILAALNSAKRGFWKNQTELLKQSVKSPIEWLAVNEIPWYRW